MSTENVSIRQVGREMCVPLADEQREEAVRELTSQLQAVEDIEEKKKYLTSVWNENVKKSETIIHELKDTLRKGVYREVPCKEIFFWAEGKVVIVNLENDEVVGERKITKDDQPMSTDETVNESNLPDKYRSNEPRRQLMISDKSQIVDAEVIEESTEKTDEN